MKNKILPFLLLLLLSAFSLQAQDKTRLSLQFNHTSVQHIFNALTQYHAFNLVADADLNQKISVQLQALTWTESIQMVCKVAKLHCELNKNTLYIQPVALDSSVLPKIAHAPEWIKVDHLPPELVTQLIQNTAHLSKQGQAIFLKEKGMILIQDSTERKKLMQQFIQELDRAPEQVHIAAHIVTMSDESIEELGVNWGYQSDSSGLSHLNLNFGVGSSTMNAGFNIATRNGRFLQLELSALEAENQIEIIASPNLMTSHQETASIKQGTEIPYEVASGNNGNTTIEFKQAVLGLEVTPRVLKEGFIELTLVITQNTAGKTIKKSDNGEYLAIDTQEIKTKIIVRQEETIVLGGIFQQQASNQTRAVPGLGTIPVIGGLFRYTGKNIQKRELVIFITPKLLKYKSALL